MPLILWSEDERDSIVSPWSGAWSGARDGVAVVVVVKRDAVAAKRHSEPGLEGLLKPPNPQLDRDRSWVRRAGGDGHRV